MIPKFRAWDKAKQKMVEEDRILIWGEDVLILDEGHYFNINDLSASEIDKKYVMQFTTILDNSENSKEIYQDDIVKRASLIPGGQDVIGVVKMLEGCWVIDNGKEAIYLWTEVEENIVIGNIYENPELVEG